MSSMPIEERLAILEQRVGDWRRATFLALAVAVLGAFVLPCTRSSLEFKSKSGGSVRIDGDGIQILGRRDGDRVTLRADGARGPEMWMRGPDANLLLGITGDGQSATLWLNGAASLVAVEDTGFLTLENHSDGVSEDLRLWASGKQELSRFPPLLEATPPTGSTDAGPPKPSTPDAPVPK